MLFILESDLKLVVSPKFIFDFNWSPSRYVAFLPILYVVGVQVTEMRICCHTINTIDQNRFAASWILSFIVYVGMWFNFKNNGDKHISLQSIVSCGHTLSLRLVNETPQVWSHCSV